MSDSRTIIKTMEDELDAAFNNLIDHKNIKSSEEDMIVEAETAWLIEAGWKPDQSNLPSSAFAIPNPNASPKGKLPHHNPDGSPNLGGLMAAIRRFHQTHASSEELAKAKSHICGHLSKLGKKTDFCSGDK